MTPLLLTLENFVGIKSGLNLDSITINFEKLCEGKELIAIKGDNGRGKSTILDNAVPYRFMASRASSYSPSAFSFYDHIRNGSASKTLDWTHNNNLYKTELKFRDTGKTKKTEAFLFTMNAGGDLEPYTMKDGTKSDGKTAVYDACIEEILGSPELYFTSAFACQNRPSLSDYTKGDVKSMFSEMMNLEHIKELGVEAGKVKDQATTILENVQEKIRGMDEDEKTHERLIDEQTGWDEQLKVTIATKKTTHDAVQTAQNVLAKAEADADAGNDIAARRTELNSRVEATENRYRKTKADLDTDIKRENGLRANSSVTYTKDRGSLERRKQTILIDIDENNAVLTRRDEIEQAAAKAKTLTDCIEILQRKITGLQDKADEALTLSGEKASADQRILTANQRLETIGFKLDEIKTRADQIDSVPCEKECSDVCFYTEDARKAVAQIKEMKAGGKALDAEISDLVNLSLSKAAMLEDLGDPGKALLENRAELTNLQDDAKRLQETSALIHKLEQAKKVVADREGEVKYIDEELNNKDTAHQIFSAESKQREEELAARQQTIASEESTELRPILDELNALPATSDVDRVAEAKSALESAKKAYDDIDLQATDISNKVATLEAKIKELGEALAMLPTYKAQAEKAEDEIGHWTALQKALSNDGIIALAIDDAGPHLSGLANDLLLACYGPRFTVSMQTQAETQKGTMKETFDIRVIDSFEGTDKSVRDMSGGERIWINEAITRAIALYMAETSGQQYETLFSDESDGALDPERKQMFIKMKRKVLELGGYKNEIFISHTPELWDLADGTIDLNDYAQ